MKLLLLFLVAAIGFQAGMAVKCYLCDNCDDTPKDSWNQLECPDNHQCLTVEKTVFLIGRPKYSHQRVCARKEASCEELYPPPFKYDPIIPDRVPPTFKCTFCDTPLCNE